MDVVTGAFGYIGRYITNLLIQHGEEVRTITTHPDKPNPFGTAVQAFPLDFTRPDELIKNLRGATILYNTYWIRFEHGSATFNHACENTRTLFQCAWDAGIRKIIHISVTNASIDSHLPYYRGKGIQEEILVNSGSPYSIIRPTLVFGKEDILINNIAWCIRRFPVFPIFGNGAYRLQPVFVEDLAQIAVMSANEPGSRIVDAIGPEVFTFEQLVKLISSKIKPGVKLMHMHPNIGIVLGRIIGLAIGDVILTRQEALGLMDEMLTSVHEPNGLTKFSEWLEIYWSQLGSTYSSELARHFY